MERSGWLVIEFGEAFQGERRTVKTTGTFPKNKQKNANGLRQRERRAKTTRVTDRLDKDERRRITLMITGSF